MVSIKDSNKKIKKILFDPIDKTKNKFSSILNDLKKNKVKKDLELKYFMKVKSGEHLWLNHQY